MKFSVITLFPELLNAFLAAGVIGRAVKDKKISVSLINPRDFATDVHRTVDDRPFGGGPGMVMKAEPLIAAILAAKAELPEATVVYLSPQGETLNQTLVRDLVVKPMILIAGRYEGIDERIIDSYVDKEISIGDFVLSGGEIAAMGVIDAVSRLTPGVLGHPMSAVEDSFGEDGLLDHPHYTRPTTLAGKLVGSRQVKAEEGTLEEVTLEEGKVDSEVVPAVLLSGDHKAIAQWRRQMAVTRTWERRPDLLAKASLSEADSILVKQLDDARDKNAD